MKKIRVGVIGLGVGEKHASIYQNDPRCELVALSDLNIEKLNQIHKKFPNTLAYEDASKILTATNIDLVSIASYDNFHAEQVLACLETNKHVYVEKPLCLNQNEFEQIKEKFKNSNLLLSSNLVLRTFPEFIQLRETIKEGTLGEAYLIEGDYNYGRLEKITAGWRGQIPFYSVSHGGGIHLIDLIFWLTNDQIVEVIATGTKIATQNSSYQYPDTITAIAKTKNGVNIKINANYASVTPHHHSLSVFGTKGTFIKNMKDSFYCFNRDEQHSSSGSKFIPSEANKSQYQKELTLLSFIEALTNKKNPNELPFYVPAEQVFASMAVSLAIEKSLETKKWELVNYN